MINSNGSNSLSTTKEDVQCSCFELCCTRFGLKSEPSSIRCLHVLRVVVVSKLCLWLANLRSLVFGDGNVTIFLVVGIERGEWWRWFERRPIPFFFLILLRDMWFRLLWVFKTRLFSKWSDGTMGSTELHAALQMGRNVNSPRSCAASGKVSRYPTCHYIGVPRNLRYVKITHL